MKQDDAVVNDTDVDEKVRRGLPQVGFYFSTAYVIFLTLMAAAAWPELWKMGPNEFGDLMAGVFAPLAFLWLVLGFFQQGQELKASVAALKIQGDELRNSVEQQRELVAASREQIALEQDQRKSALDERIREAQPVLIPKVDRSQYADGGIKFLLRFANLSKIASDVEVRIDGNLVAHRPNLPTSEFLTFWMQFSSVSEVKPIQGIIAYTDELGIRRGRSFEFPVGDASHPQKHKVLLDGVIKYALLSGPFHWE